MLTSLLGFSTLTLLSSLVSLCKFVFAFVYPLFRSVRIARGKEPDENKLRLLKFWIIYALMYLTVYWIQSLLDILEVTDIALTCIYFMLIVNNFKGAEFVYEKVIAEGFGKCEKQLHEFFKQLRKLFENSVYSVLMALKELVFAFLAGVVPMLPSPVKWFLDMAGITKLLEGSLNRQQDYEQKAKANAERRRKQTEIERNRPESPNKKERISFAAASGKDKTPGNAGKSDNKVDIVTKKTVDGAKPVQRASVTTKRAAGEKQPATANPL